MVRCLVSLCFVTLTIGGCAAVDPEQPADDDAEVDLEEREEDLSGCPSGTLPSGNGPHCAPVIDKEHEFPPGLAIAGGKAVPDLSTLRGGPTSTSSEEDLPVPGGLGAGTLYDQGRLKVTTSADFRTVMIVHPSGIGTLSNWIFTTATNRTQKTIEAVAIYNGSGSGSFGIFDWSCSSAYPCSNDSTSASWIWTKDLDDMSCYWRTLADPGGHSHYAMSYRNTTKKLDSGSPPLWRNRVAMWNDCTDVWANVYTHEYRANLKDCSSDNSCGWWGPIIENFIDGTLPNIKELGFWSTNLYHDGQLSILGTDDTNWVAPAAPWKVYHRNANRSWGVGTNTNK